MAFPPWSGLTWLAHPCAARLTFSQEMSEVLKNREAKAKQQAEDQQFDDQRGDFRFIAAQDEPDITWCNTGIHWQWEIPVERKIICNLGAFHCHDYCRFLKNRTHRLSSNACWWISLNRHSFVSESLKSCWWAFLGWSLCVSSAIRPFFLTNLHMFLGKIHMFTNMKSLFHDSQIEFHVSIDYILFFDRFFLMCQGRGSLKWIPLGHRSLPPCKRSKRRTSGVFGHNLVE